MHCMDFISFRCQKVFAPPWDTVSFPWKPGRNGSLSVKGCWPLGSCHHLGHCALSKHRLSRKQFTSIFKAAKKRHTGHLFRVTLKGEIMVRKKYFPGLLMLFQNTFFLLFHVIYMTGKPCIWGLWFVCDQFRIYTTLCPGSPKTLVRKAGIETWHKHIYDRQFFQTFYV